MHKILAPPLLAFASLAILAVAFSPACAGDVEVVHVGEATVLHLEGNAWTFDKAASRQAHLVSVQKVSASGGSQRYVVRGLKTGQVKLVFRSGPRTFLAHVDVLK